MGEKHIFISYNRKDGGRFAETLERILDEANLPVWRDPDIGAGETWRSSIDDAIRESGALVVIMSPEAKTSGYVNYEWAFALGAGLTVVPVLLGLPREQLHPCLAERQALDFSDPCERDWGKLLVRLKQLSRTCRPAPPRSQRGLPPALENAARGIDSTDAAERLRAIETLKQMNHPEAAEVLAGALRHAVSDVRVEAAFALVRLRDIRCIPGLLEGAVISRRRDRLYEALERLGPAAVPELVRSFQDSNEGIRCCAVRAVNQFVNQSPDPALLPALTQALGDSDSHVRAAAVEALGNYAPAAPMGAIIERLSDEESHVRAAAVCALRKVGGAEAVRPLTEALRDPDFGVRDRAIQALAEARATAAVPALIEALRRRDRSNYDREARLAAEALGKIGDPAAVPALADALEDLEYSAKDALAAIGGPAALAALRAILQNPNGGGRASAIDALREILGPEAVPELVALLQDEDPRVRLHSARALARLKAPEAISALVSLLGDPDQNFCADAKAELAEIGSAAVPALVEALKKDEDEDVRAAAEAVLDRIGTREAKAALRAFRRATRA